MTKTEEAQFQKMYMEHEALVHKVCRMYSDSIEDFEDNVQEVGLQLWKSFSTFEGRSKRSTWVYRVALNVCMFQLKKRKRVALLQQKASEHPPEDDIEYKELVEERSQSLSTAVKRLKELDRAIIILYLDDLPYKDIANVLGISVSNVGVKINRIKAQLKEMMNG